MPPSSLSPSVRRRLRVGIVGAGSAGLAAAIALARRGHQVHVFEKHPSLATLGAGLLIQPQGVEALSELGVGSEFEAASVPVDRLHGICHRNWSLVDLAYRPQREARAVSRAALAHLLLKAAQDAGAMVNFGARVDQIETGDGAGAVRIGQQRLAFDMVVIADGAASTLPAQVGLAVAASSYKWGALWGMFDVEHWAGERVLQQRYRTTRQMFGLMPTARIGGKLRLSLFWSLPCDAYAGWKASSLEAWKEELLGLWPESAPVVNQITMHDQLTFASYYHARPSRLAMPPVCVIGDAAHAMSPQLGLGATLAVQDALCLAENVDAHGPQAGLIAFSRRRARTVAAYQMLSRALTPCFQADGNGWWRDAAFAFGRHVPGVNWLMFRSLAEPGGKRRAPLPDAAPQPGSTE